MDTHRIHSALLCHFGERNRLPSRNGSGASIDRQSSTGFLYHDFQDALFFTRIQRVRFSLAASRK